MMKDEKDLLPFQEAICPVVEELGYETDIYIRKDECYGKATTENQRDSFPEQSIYFFCVRKKACC